MFCSRIEKSIDFEGSRVPLAQAALGDRSVLRWLMSPKEEELELLAIASAGLNLLEIGWKRSEARFGHGSFIGSEDDYSLGETRARPAAVLDDSRW